MVWIDEQEDVGWMVVRQHIGLRLRHVGSCLAHVLMEGSQEPQRGVF